MLKTSKHRTVCLQGLERVEPVSSQSLKPWSLEPHVSSTAKSIAKLAVFRVGFRWIGHCAGRNLENPLGDHFCSFTAGVLALDP